MVTWHNMLPVLLLASGTKSTCQNTWSAREEEDWVRVYCLLTSSWNVSIATLWLQSAILVRPSIHSWFGIRLAPLNLSSWRLIQNNVLQHRSDVAFGVSKVGLWVRHSESTGRTIHRSKFSAPSTRHFQQFVACLSKCVKSGNYFVVHFLAVLLRGKSQPSFSLARFFQRPSAKPGRYVLPKFVSQANKAVRPSGIRPSTPLAQFGGKWRWRLATFFTAARTSSKTKQSLKFLLYSRRLRSRATNSLADHLQFWRSRPIARLTSFNLQLLCCLLQQRSSRPNTLLLIHRQAQYCSCCSTTSS